MAKNYYDITLALAGICQAAHLAQQLAHQGQCDSETLNVSLRSLLDMNPPSALAVFGNKESHLRFGLEILIGMLNSSSRQNASIEITRYTLSLMMLERKLSKNTTALSDVGQRINQLNRQLVHYELGSPVLTGAIAAIYVDIISPLGPRIQVIGSPVILQNSQIQEKIRATLLAGIRAAVLWHQVGGSRLQLMFSRTRLTKEARKIIYRITTQPSAC